MRGGYGDDYYMQLIRKIREYKGIAGETKTFSPLAINIKGRLAQWEAAAAVYQDFVGSSSARSCKDAASQTTQWLTLPAARNDLAEIRVANDADNLYFLIAADKPITAHTAGDVAWMNLLINVEGDEGASFEGFQYIINRDPGKNTTSVERSDGGYNFTNIGTAACVLSGKYLQISVPRELLGIKDGGFTITFKAADNVAKPDDILEYYVSGDSAPIGRLAYTYSGI